jgi:hypothetical protein
MVEKTAPRIQLQRYEILIVCSYGGVLARDSNLPQDENIIPSRRDIGYYHRPGLSVDSVPGKSPQRTVPSGMAPFNEQDMV